MELVFVIALSAVCFIIGFYFKKLLFHFSQKSTTKKYDDFKRKNPTESQNEYNDYGYENEDLKMVFLVRKDLKMGVGKIGAQVAHAAVGLCYEIMQGNSIYHQKALEYWNEFGAKKVVLSVDNLETMKEVCQQCKINKIPHIMISDAGHTQIAAGSITVLGIGVDSSNKINEITGKFKLMN